MSLLPWTIYLSLIGAAATLAAGRRSAAAARWVALLAALLPWGLVLAAAVRFTPAAQPQSLVDIPWIPAFGIRYHLAADGISMVLLVLTGLAATAAVLFSWNIEERAGEFFAFFLILIAGVYGVFLSADAFLFFAFYELAIVPKYFLIATWGSTNREYGAMKLVLYSFAGSALVLAGLLWVYASGGAAGFGFGELAAAAARVQHGSQIGMFALVFFGFAVLAGLFPFHTWAPTGHVAAPTAASMLLAGVVMKLGAYGCLRIAMPLFPAGLAALQPLLAWLAVAGIVYAGLVALVQDDCKFVIGYSSVAHMGFVMLGLAAASSRAVAGAVLQMFSHGVIAGLLFAVVGRMVYDRTHTRKLAELRRMGLGRALPFAAAIFVLAGLASMGIPGFSGFPAELSILIGAWKAVPAWAAVAAIGIPIGAAFTLRVVTGIFFGENQPALEGGAARPCDASGAASPQALSPSKAARLTWPERTGALLLLAATILIGLKPDLLLNWIIPSLQSPLFQAFLKGGHP